MTDIKNNQSANSHTKEVAENNDGSERLTSVAVPREVQAEIRKLALTASGEQGRRVAAWELIAEALLGDKKDFDSSESSDAKIDSESVEKTTDTCAWRSVSERASELGVSLSWKSLLSVSLRARSKFLSDHGEPVSRVTETSRGKEVSVYPPSFFRVIGDMLHEQVAIDAVAGRDWSLFKDEAKNAGRKSPATKKGPYKISQEQKAKRFRNMVSGKKQKKEIRDRLVFLMHEQIGLDDFQIAHTFVKHGFGVNLIVPGIKTQPDGLVDIAKEYMSKCRGYKPGPLIQRIIAKSGFDRNQPMEPRDIRVIINRAKKQARKEPTVQVMKKDDIGDVRGDKSEALTSVSVPRSLFYRLKRISTDATINMKRSVFSYEIIKAALDAYEKDQVEVFDNIRAWAEARNIIGGCTTRDQFLKLTEEVGELAQAILKDDDAEFVDAIGDIVVVLTILARQHGTSIERCVEAAWDEIKDRRGRIVNGTWVKES